MAQSRRIQLTTLSCDAGLPSSSVKQAPASKTPPGVQQEKENHPDTNAVRLVLTLFEPDERSFPEFSYSQLIENKITGTKDEVPLSRFEEEEKRENDEVAAIARKLEEKYGSKPKKKKDRVQDLIDIGYGYDDEDSFIDNSEAKRKLNGSKDKPKKKACREDGEIRTNVDQESSIVSNNGVGDELRKKKKKAAGTLSVTSMLKKFQREKERERQKMEKANQRATAITRVPTFPLCPADAAGGGGSGLTDPLLSLIGSTNDHALIQAANTVDFDIDLDSLLDVSEDSSSSKTASQPPTDEQLSQPKSDVYTQSDFTHIEVQPENIKTNLSLKPQTERTQIGSTSAQHVLLPEGLPASLEDSIQKLMMAARTSEGESKKKFFSPEINSVLLDVELQCREHGSQLRSKVFTHLSSFLPCSKDTLLKRVKKLLVAHMEGQPDVEDPVQKLKEAIGKVMPDQIATFLENCQAYEQVKASKATEERDGKQALSAGPEDNVEEKSGKKGGPRKWFKWNEEIRECFSQVVRVKMEGYKKERKGSQEMEEYLKTLLDNEVKPLWPKGWIQSRVLLRVSKKVLGLSPSLPVKRAKSEKRQQPSSCGPEVQESQPHIKEAEDVFTGSPSTSVSPSVDGEKEEVKSGERNAMDTGSTKPVETNGSPVITTPPPTSSLLDLLADQALAREQPLSVSQELLAAAVSKYYNSVQHRSFEFDTKSPLLPPPPPQTSPVVMPEKIQMGDFTQNVDAADVVVISDESDTAVI
ncbi:ubinuclein-1-like isoform X2 [Cheilinus undulatus]|uniref:ubinuclein-1-like isoform X2 n=1 Tax=Cheilinus undulatus TaxID=241271 RepID=UPI001BD375E8|nr:ubinuclein-1-like isoform X2 [Cheilinus undulatus]